MSAAHPVRLHRELILLPVTDELFDAVVARFGSEGEAYPEVFWKFSPALCTLARSLVDDRPFAYVETEYFGGVGTQAAAVWRGRDLISAPAKAESGVINEALARLGVRRGLFRDRFDRVGLSRHRSTEEWLSEDALTNF